MNETEFSLKPLKKAAKTLAEALNEKKTALVRDATIQRFEYTYELSWKTMRRYFNLNNQFGIRQPNPVASGWPVEISIGAAWEL